MGCIVANIIHDALLGIKPGSQADCHRLTQIGLMRFTGNQWNESWDWDREKVRSLSVEDAERLYQEVKHG